MATVRYIPRKVKPRDSRNPEGGYYESKCDVCGQTYYPKRDNTKYCSQTCAMRATRNRRIERAVLGQGSGKRHIVKSKTIAKTGCVVDKPKKNNLINTFDSYILCWKFIKEFIDSDIQVMKATLQRLKGLAIDESFTVIDDMTVTRISETKYRVKA